MDNVEATFLDTILTEVHKTQNKICVLKIEFDKLLELFDYKPAKMLETSWPYIFKDKSVFKYKDLDVDLNRSSPVMFKNKNVSFYRSMFVQDKNMKIIQRLISLLKNATDDNQLMKIGNDLDMILTLQEYALGKRMLVTIKDEVNKSTLTSKIVFEYDDSYPYCEIKLSSSDFLLVMKFDAENDPESRKLYLTMYDFKIKNVVEFEKHCNRYLDMIVSFLFNEFNTLIQTQLDNINKLQDLCTTIAMINKI